MAYVKYIDEHTVKYAPLNYQTADKTILNFRNSPELVRQYGYKPLEEAEKDYSRPFHIEFEEFDDVIKEVIVYDPLDDDDPAADNSGDTVTGS